jgi:glutathione S-transferase
MRAKPLVSGIEAICWGLKDAALQKWGSRANAPTLFSLRENSLLAAPVFLARSYAYYSFNETNHAISHPESLKMKVYYTPLSGHCHRVQLFASLINADVEFIELDLGKGQHLTPEFLELNPFGEVPVLVDGDAVVSDSNAILVYLATLYQKTNWLPTTPAGAAAVQKWLSVAAGEIMYGPAAARLVTVFGKPFNGEEVIARAHRVLKLVDAHLADSTWLAAAHPTIADLALYSYIARAPEGFVDLSAYANVNAWLARIEALPNFVEFPKTAAGLHAA